MKVDLSQFTYSAQLPNGQPLNLNIAVPRDGNYANTLMVWVALLAQALEDFKREIGGQKAQA